MSLDIFIYPCGQKKVHILSSFNGISDKSRRNLYHRRRYKPNAMRLSHRKRITGSGIYNKSELFQYRSTLFPCSEPLIIVGTDKQAELTVGMKFLQFSKGINHVRGSRQGQFDITKFHMLTIAHRNLNHAAPVYIITKLFVGLKRIHRRQRQPYLVHCITKLRHVGRKHHVTYVYRIKRSAKNSNPPHRATNELIKS